MARVTLKNKQGKRNAVTVGSSEYNRLLKSGYSLEQANPRKAGVVTGGPVDSVALDPNQALIDSIMKAMNPNGPPVAPPTFENSGLWNEADEVAKIKADYDPTFAQELQALNLTQEQDRSGMQREALRNQLMQDQEQQYTKFNQQQQIGGLQGDYYNRGLSRSGAIQGALGNLGQQQQMQTADMNQRQQFQNQDFGERQRMQQFQQPLAQSQLQNTQRSTIAGVKSNAYDQAFRRFLNQFSNK